MKANSLNDKHSTEHWSRPCIRTPQKCLVSRIVVVVLCLMIHVKVSHDYLWFTFPSTYTVSYSTFWNSVWITEPLDRGACLHHCNALRHSVTRQPQRQLRAQRRHGGRVIFGRHEGTQLRAYGARWLVGFRDRCQSKKSHQKHRAVNHHIFW